MVLTPEGRAAALGRLLALQGLTIATAESCTGGLLGGLLTAEAGSSAWYRGGFVTYCDQAKIALLGVRADDLARHTAVSEPVARAMARGARERLGADFALSTTGWAGPDGEERGTVWIGLADGRETFARRFSFDGSREEVRRRALDAALDMLEERIKGGPHG